MTLSDYHSILEENTDDTVYHESAYHTKGTFYGESVDDDVTAVTGFRERWGPTVVVFYIAVVAIAVLSFAYIGSKPASNVTSFVSYYDSNTYKRTHSNIGTLFSLASPTIILNGTLPDQYTCKQGVGSGVSPPLNWTDAPGASQDFMVAMEKVGGYSWCVYDLVGLSSLPANNTDIGITGGTVEFSSTDKHVTRYTYDEPCSKGPGMRVYSFIIFAFSKPVVPVLTAMGVSAKSVNPILVLDLMADSYLGSAVLPCNFTLYTLPNQ